MILSFLSACEVTVNNGQPVDGGNDEAPSTERVVNETAPDQEVVVQGEAKEAFYDLPSDPSIPVGFHNASNHVNDLIKISIVSSTVGGGQEIVRFVYSDHSETGCNEAAFNDSRWDGQTFRQTCGLIGSFPTHQINDYRWVGGQAMVDVCTITQFGQFGSCKTVVVE